MYKNITTLIFDMDGVITSENKYWNTARITVWEILSSDSYIGLNNYFDEGDSFLDQLALLGKNVISSDFIYELKRRAVNSNWDLAFFVLSLHLISILHSLKETQPEFWIKFLNANSLSIEQQFTQLREFLSSQTCNFKNSDIVIGQFWQETESLTGTAVVEYLHPFSKAILNTDMHYLKPKGELWKLCYHNFQEWYEGKGDYSLPDDDTVVDLSELKQMFSKLCELRKYSLGIATGRPRSEVIHPMLALGLLSYFEGSRIATYDEVLQAEELASQLGKHVLLAKPHPFVLLKAIHPDEDVRVLYTEEFQSLDRSYAAYIGDAASDVVAAKCSNCISIGVLTGCVDGRAIASQQKMLIDSGCNVILSSVLDLPNLLGV
jgi:phosphoglycolate phosphatase-like HAD superfamily hydrolase